MEFTLNFPTDKLVPYARNSRTHSDEQVAQIMASIKEFGFTNPILIGSDDVIIAGHGRLLAAQRLGMSEVPVVRLPHLSDTQRKALVIADNKLALNAGWDEKLLALEIDELKGLDFDLDLLGFNMDELNELEFLGEEKEEPGTDENAVPEAPAELITKKGDVWQLGNHRLLCGDTTMYDDIKKLMADDVADMVFTDPPYNVNYGATMKDSLRHKTSDVNAGRTIMNDNLGDGFAQFLTDSLSNLMMFNRGAIYVCMSSSELHTLHNSFVVSGGKWSTFIIWAKNTFTLGRADYQRQYEPILYGWGKDKPHYWCGDRNQSDVWEYNKPLKNDLHPTMKPIELVERAINNSSKVGGIVLDGFGGSGSTLIAAEKTGRHARLMELDPKYVDVIIKRFEEYSGKKAVLLNN
ncbi:MAG: site-specific DNA-methyltransferase [Alphaproteobacteria bacterium]